ncbi:MAG: heavy-metal-associated domain-containing protein [Ktedonobacteraceae bacterium]|nr:heavy-metal-associated domain-containing protein [Ktedonobacteraceae bacterium]
MLECVTLTLPKIGCQGCMKRVVTALSAVPTVEIVETSVPAKAVSLRYENGQVNMEQIEAALHSIGHRIGKKEVIRQDAPLASAH